MNVICSSLICGFIVYHAHKSNKILGRRWDNDNGRVFNHVLEIIMEAMLPYSLRRGVCNASRAEQPCGYPLPLSLRHVHGASHCRVAF